MSMMNEDFFRILLFVFFLGIVIYFFTQSANQKIREGLDASCKDSVGACASDANTNLVNVNNLAGDTVNISKYRKDYENIIINYEKYLDLKSLTFLLQAKPDDDSFDTAVEKINKYQECKRNLNDMMKFVDSS